MLWQSRMLHRVDRVSTILASCRIISGYSTHSFPPILTLLEGLTPKPKNLFLSRFLFRETPHDQEQVGNQPEIIDRQGVTIPSTNFISAAATSKLRGSFPEIPATPKLHSLIVH